MPIKIPVIIIFPNLYLYKFLGVTVKVYINGVLKFEVPGRQAFSHYFKIGVYA